MMLLASLLALASAGQPAPAPARGPAPAEPGAATKWSFSGWQGGCSATLPLAGGAALELGFHVGRDENYFRIWDPAWPAMRAGTGERAALRFAPGDEEAAESIASRIAQAGERVGLVLRPARGTARLRRIGRAGTFQLVVGGRPLGTYALPQAEAAMARLVACARESVGGPPPPGRSTGAALNTYFSTGDYPREALRRREQGTVRFSLLIGPDGRVAECNVTGSSGSASLDETTCRILRERLRYSPARNPQGNAVSWREADQAVTWALPGR